MAIQVIGAACTSMRGLILRGQVALSLASGSAIQSSFPRLQQLTLTSMSGTLALVLHEDFFAPLKRCPALKVRQHPSCTTALEGMNYHVFMYFWYPAEH